MSNLGAKANYCESEKKQDFGAVLKTLNLQLGDRTILRDSYNFPAILPKQLDLYDSAFMEIMNCWRSLKIMKVQIQNFWSRTNWEKMSLVIRGFSSMYKISGDGSPGCCAKNAKGFFFPKTEV